MRNIIIKSEERWRNYKIEKRERRIKREVKNGNNSTDNFISNKSKQEK